MRKACLYAMLLLVALLPAGPVAAQQGEAEGPVYIVQAGDSLWAIAVRFRVSVDDLASLNGISDANKLAVGDRLIIPGLTGMSGVLTTTTVAYGDTLTSLSRRYRIPVESLTQLNHLTIPAELYAGASLVILEENLAVGATHRVMLQPGQSLLELAILKGSNPWALALDNRLEGTLDALPGEALHTPVEGASGEPTSEPSALPEQVRAVQIDPDPLVQGKATVVRLRGVEGLSIGGSLTEHKLNFFTTSSGEYASLQGIPAMTEPGLYSLALTITLPAQTGAPFTFSQAVVVRSGDYPFDPPLTVAPETIDPDATGPEDTQWKALATPVTQERLWEGIFKSPVAEAYSECWPSRFGNRRSYNGSAYSYFHTGLDFCGKVGDDVYAPAAGRVVFAGPLTVRGNATMIDHGWGIYTAYMHQSEMLVKVGDMVEAGQLIGRVGKTGRITGPHLHWEVWVGGVQVDPLDWLKKIFPF